MNPRPSSLFLLCALCAFAADFSSAASIPRTPHLPPPPDDPPALPAPALAHGIELPMLTPSIRCSDPPPPPGETLLAASTLQLAHSHSTATEQHPFVAPLLARGVKLTT